MATAMLNVRLDKCLKAEGDSVLARQGVSVTEAIRGLYKFLEENEEVPDFCRSESAKPSPETRRQKMRQLVGVAKLSPGEDFRTLKTERLSKIEF